MEPAYQHTHHSITQVNSPNGIHLKSVRHVTELYKITPSPPQKKSTLLPPSLECFSRSRTTQSSAPDLTIPKCWNEKI